MASEKEQQIRALCDAWVKAASSPGGGTALGPETGRLRLHRNGIRFDELSYDELQAACTSLSNVLLRPGLNTIIDADHLLFWAWAGELLLSPEAKFFSADEMELQQLFSSAIRASLAPIGIEKRWAEMDHNARELVTKAHLVLVYLALPLLEGLLKKVCQRYVDYSGKVVAHFQVPPRGRFNGQYNTGARCSSLRDLMYLLYQVVADQDLRPRLDEMRSMLQALDSTADPFDTLYTWRNQSLHGQASFPTIGGTLMNLAVLISVNQLRQDYEVHRRRACEEVQWCIETARSTGHRHQCSYYPPF